MTHQRITRARVSFTGGIDPATARDTTTRALSRVADSLSSTRAPARGHLPALAVEVHLPDGVALTASALAAAIEVAVRRQVAD